MSDFLSILKQNKAQPKSSTSLLGEVGERMAAEFLDRNGYQIVLSNFKVPVGRNSKGVQVTGEIDLVALDGGVLCFIEVKTRSSTDFAPVLAAVDRRKQRQITRTARVYRRIFDLWEIPYRFDVVTVLVTDGMPPTIELSRGFWSEDVFRKSSWSENAWHEPQGNWLSSDPFHGGWQ